MRLDVLVGTTEEFENALAAPQSGEDAAAYYGKLLDDAADKKTDCLDLKSVAPLEKQSDNFAVMGTIERTILDFLKDHEYPKAVRIVCNDEDTARTYKVVYNFWFAESKAERLNGEGWD